jgi:D-alanyl-D-alanine dipeptidase
MKKVITFILLYIAVYVGAMLFVQKRYNYDWTPISPREKLGQSIEDLLIKEGSPTLMTDKLPESPSKANISFEKASIDNKKSASIKQEEKLPTQDSAKESSEEINSQQTQQEITSEETAITEEKDEIDSAEETTQNNLQELSVDQEIEQEQNTPIAQESEKKKSTLEEQLAAANLVDIRSFRTKVFLRMKYATTDNFTERKLYNKAKCYLKKPVAQALVKAAKLAVEEEVPFWLCIYDCYRPTSVQKIMLKSVKEQGFLSKVSNHSRGMAVDVGPCNMQGEPLLTPNTFDTFSDASGAYYYGDEVPDIAIDNRTALQEVMKKAGFNTISNEWWHFDYKGAKNEEPLDIRF